MQIASANHLLSAFSTAPAFSGQDSVASFSAPITAADASGSTWIQLLPAGTFSARLTSRGPFQTGDQAAMQAIVDRTMRLAGGKELVVDYDHQSVFGAVPGVGGRAPAAGWIKDLQVRTDGIYGRVEWTDVAATAIRAGEYKYISPVFAHSKDGKVIALRMAGLTNVPDLDLRQVAASALFATETENGDSMDKILAALGLAKGSGEDAALSAINSLLASSTAIAKAAGLKDGATPAEILTAVNSAFADRKAFARAAGLKDDARTDEIATAITAAMTGIASAGNPDPTKFVPIAAVTELQAEVKKLSDSLVEDKAKDAVEAAMSAGKLAPALKDWGLDLYRKDAKAFETFIGSAPALTAPQLKTPVKGANGEEALGDVDVAVCKALGIDPKKFRATIAAEKAEEEKS
jgi:phage I-like protein